MLDLAFEMIGQATSNSLLMFCFCNLIIVIILTGSKPGSIVDQETAFPTSSSLPCNMPESADEEIITTNLTSSSNENDELSIDVSTISEEREEPVEEDRESGHYNDEDEDGNDVDDCETEHQVEEEEEEDDDDLRQRVEEFIAKVNQEWKNEKLRTFNLVFAQ